MKKINTEIIIERDVEDVRKLEGTRTLKRAGFVYEKRRGRTINYISCYKCNGFTVNIRQGICNVCKKALENGKQQES